MQRTTVGDEKENGMAQVGSISGSLAADQLDRVNAANKALLADQRCADRESRVAYQEACSKLGSLALPPSGHSCPGCCRAGDLYCYYIAVERLRGQRAR